jgi:hypothetical protein
LVGRAEQYPWSSAAAHLVGPAAGGLVDVELRRELPAAMHYADALETPPGEQETGRLRRATLAGLPLGAPKFVHQLDRACGRRLMHDRPRSRSRSAGAAA